MEHEEDGYASDHEDEDDEEEDDDDKDDDGDICVFLDPATNLVGKIHENMLLAFE